MLTVAIETKNKPHDEAHTPGMHVGIRSLMLQRPPRTR
jgi:hypothetical protein